MSICIWITHLLLVLEVLLRFSLPGEVHSILCYTGSIHEAYRDEFFYKQELIITCPIARIVEIHI